MAFQIIRHAFRMVFGNLGDALKVSIGPYVILILVALFATLIAAGIGSSHYSSRVMTSTNGLSMGVVIATLLFGLGGLFVFSWVAVSWHRFILLEEYPGTLPQLSGRPIWPYVWRLMGYSLILVAVALPVSFLLGNRGLSLITSGGIVGNLVTILIAAGFGYLWFRMALALPSVAVGAPITLGQAWAASKGMSGTIFRVALLLVGLYGIASLVSLPIMALSPFLGGLLNIVLQWTVVMVGISILTTLYGHLIEGRDVPD